MTGLLETSIVFMSKELFATLKFRSRLTRWLPLDGQIKSNMPLLGNITEHEGRSSERPTSKDLPEPVLHEAMESLQAPQLEVFLPETTIWRVGRFVTYGKRQVCKAHLMC
jgi:hypothetical protein